MTWTDYQTPTVLIDTGDGKERPVRGLGLDDFTALLTNNLDAMMEATDLYINMQKDVLSSGNQVELITVLSKSFPALVMEVISMVTDTPELRTKRVPAGLQLRILSAALKLTVEDVGGLGNLSAMLQNAVRVVVANRGEASQRLAAILSPSSIGGAGKTPTGS